MMISGLLRPHVTCKYTHSYNHIRGSKFSDCAPDEKNLKMVKYQKYRAVFVYFYFTIMSSNIGIIFFQDRGFLSRLTGNTEDCKCK